MVLIFFLSKSVASGARYSELKYYVTDVPFFFSDDIHALLSFHYFFLLRISIYI